MYIRFIYVKCLHFPGDQKQISHHLQTIFCRDVYIENKAVPHQSAPYVLLSGLPAVESG